MVDEAAVVMSTHLISAVEALVQLPSYLVAELSVIRPDFGSTNIFSYPAWFW